MAWDRLPERTQTLQRMTEALRAAKLARDRGVNVADAREELKQARAAFAAGDYPTARALADRIIQRLGPVASAPAGPGWTAPPPNPATLPERSTALDRMNQALETAKQAEAQGAVVRKARKHLKRMKAAYDRGNYRTAVEEADRVIEACGFTR